MTAVLCLRFDDGSVKNITIDKAIEINTSGKQELSFRETNKGWVMAFTKSILEGHKLADMEPFLHCRKD